MSDLIVRRLLIDMAIAPARHWNGGDAFRTAFFNALSMSFPAGEQFFMDAVRAGVKTLPAAQREAFDAELRGFVGQEATHRRIHALFNQHLQRQGLVNHWEPRILRRIQALEGQDPRLAVAVTAATEHFTAILADYLLRHGQALAGAEAHWAVMWQWHASEESEHRSTAFDLYRAMGGDEAWRRRVFWIVSWHFTTDVLRQTMHNLWRDGSLFRPATWLSAARLFLGREGLLSCLAGPWRRYVRADFHPSQQDGAPATAWLQAHQAWLQPLAQPPGSQRDTVPTRSWGP